MCPAARAGTPFELGGAGGDADGDTDGRCHRIVVDLAVEQGGNVEGAVAGEVVERHGVRILGHRNVPSRLAADTSALFARNLYNFLSAYWDKDAGRPVLPDEDEVTQGIRLTRGGAVVHPRLLQA